MAIKRKIVAPTLLVAMVIGACSKQHGQLEAMVPAGASSVSYIHQSDFSDGVTFHIISEPESYRYVEGIRKALASEGFSPCKKSAISDWTKKPIQAGEAYHEGYWISELYKRKDFGKFFMIRVDGTPIDGGMRWRQGFLLAAQIVPEGRQDMGSIKEFCD